MLCTEKVFRKITIDGQARIDFLSKNNLLKESIDKKFLIPTKKLLIRLSGLLLGGVFEIPI